MTERYRFEEGELRQQEFWREQGAYRFQKGAPLPRYDSPASPFTGREAGERRPVFSIDTPPPTVSGSLHIGHLFSYTQAEMVARHRRMTGWDVFYPFGFDDNGLPTERLVEKEQKLRARDLPRSQFAALCRQTALRYEEQFRGLWESLGFSVDWEQQYQTISPAVQRISQRSFVQLAQKGLAYCKESPVLWCTQCRTSIAQAELEVQERESVFYTLPFFLGEKALAVATTRPELLCGCVCLFVHPEDGRAGDLVGKTARVPLYDFEIPILAEETVERERGTGLVMCATFGDMTDAGWVEKHGLAEKRVLTPEGRFAPGLPLVEGKTVKAARAAVVEALRERGLVLGEEPITHTVAVHERCGTETEILTSKQWYIDVLSHREELLKAGERVNWHPASMQARYRAWVENLKWDWCISRQRYFGVPFPVWYCKSCGRPVFAREEDLPVNPLEDSPEKACPCGCTEFYPETAVLDTWATSSLTPMINARWGEEDDRSDLLAPMSLRCQAHEIIRTWAFYTIVKSLYHTGRLPWKDIMISGFVLAKRGEKISKSKGNASHAPEELVKTYSADVMRCLAAGAKLGTDTFFEERELRAAARFVTKLTNAAGFMLSHLEDFDPFAPPPALLPADRWLLARAGETVLRADALFGEYEVGQARAEIDSFFWHEVCDTYIELAKERLYRPDSQGTEARCSGQYALYHTLLTLLKLYAPYVPHVTEHFYRQYFARYEGSPTLHLTQWPRGTAAEPQLARFGLALREVLAEARKQKSEQGLSMKSPIPRVAVRCEEDLRELFRQEEMDLKCCTGAEEIVYG